MCPCTRTRCDCIAQVEDDLFRAQMSEEALFARCDALSSDLQAQKKNLTKSFL
jgi:hypothetical protein